MEEETIPVPAESARTLAISASDEIPELRENGYKLSADDLEGAVSDVLAATEGKDGEFASVPQSAISTITSRANVFDNHRDAARTFLEQYKVW